MRSLIPLLLITIAVGLFFLFIDPHYESVQLLQAEQQEYQNALDQARELQNRRDELLTTYNSFSQDNIARLNRILPSEVNVVKLVADIDSIAGQYGIVVSNVSVTEALVDNEQDVLSDEETAAPYNATTISFGFAARYPDLVDFLRDLEKSLQLIDVQSVSFDVGSEESGGGVYDYTVSLKTYWLR